MTAGQDGLDLAKVQAEHQYHRGGPDGGCVLTGRHNTTDRCLPYRLAALALDLQGKVARVEAARTPHTVQWKDSGIWGYAYSPSEIDAALADPTPAARCPQQTPFEALSEPTCTRPEGHEGAHLFTSYDGKTPLEMMPK